MLEAHQTEIMSMAWILVIAIAIRITGLSFGSRSEDPLEELLKKRYINGEITEEECKRKERFLQTGGFSEKEECESFTVKQENN